MLTYTKYVYYTILSTNWTFSLWCVSLIKYGSLNWPWSTEILGKFITRMLKFIVQSDVKHIMTWSIKTMQNNAVSSEGLNRYLITNIHARPIGLVEILVIMSVSTFKIAVILYIFMVPTLTISINENIFFLNRLDGMLLNKTLTDYVNLYKKVCIIQIYWWYLPSLFLSMTTFFLKQARWNAPE